MRRSRRIRRPFREREEGDVAVGGGRGVGIRHLGVGIIKIHAGCDVRGHLVISRERLTLVCGV